MRCETCGGRGYVLPEMPRGYDPWLVVAIPCPELDCHNGHRHCCEGLQCQPEPTETETGA
jgi:hypothetical protein